MATVGTSSADNLSNTVSGVSILAYAGDDTIQQQRLERDD